ncbi:hypothetical protein [Aldersonia kunmingensis]|uniref:hypothetical protein n=1 Tax=Aldersonia kunmingensis TaxID=408066 RepID=UPI000836BF13|nr:hypothetical protein [Aldersonia kunmingensis]
MSSVSKVTLSTELPLPAETVAGLCRKPETMLFVLSPVVRFRELHVPDLLEVGAEASGRIWWFGIIPSWTHRLTVVKADPLEIYTNERSGPARVWNHRLTFEPIDANSCRYTDEIETESGWRGAPTRLFVRLMFAHRHRRWQTLAGILS